MEISVILPTYNELDSSPQIIDKILRLFPNNDCIELIVVDDCSPDGTAAYIRKRYMADGRVKVLIRKGKKPGLGDSIMEGILFSSGKIIIGLDADGNHPPELIPTLVDRLSNGFDVAVASRFMGNIGQNFIRLQDFGSLIFNYIIRSGFGYPIWDNTSGYYAIRRSVLASLPLKDIFANSYGEYHLKLMYAVHKKGYTITEVPVTYEKRIGGISKSSPIKMLLSYFREAYHWKKTFNSKYGEV